MLLCQNCHLLKAEVLLHCSVHLDHVQLRAAERKESQGGDTRCGRFGKATIQSGAGCCGCNRVEAPTGGRYSPQILGGLKFRSHREEKPLCPHRYTLSHQVARDVQPARPVDTKTIVNTLVEVMFNRLGAPEVIHMNQGKKFESCLFATVCEKVGFH